jgi:succinoglycan biosynthesis transport protein ExoP
MKPQADLDFPTFLALLRRRARLIIGIGLAAAVLAFAISSLFPDRYDASADLLFHQPSGPVLVNPNEPGSEVSAEPERVAATNLALASLDIVAVRVKQSIDTSLSVKELRDSVSIQPQGQADVVTITARASTPEEAAEVANAFASEVVALRRESARTKIQKVIDAIGVQLAQSTSLSPEVSAHLSSRASQLEVQKRLEAGDAEVVEQALPPDSPASPKPLRNAIVALLLGLILGVVVAVLLRRFDRHVHDEEDIVEIIGAPIVGRVPVIKEDDGWKYDLALESFQFLRANLQLRSTTSSYRTFAVTSALPGEGKSTVAMRLAQAMALSGSSVILTDCDLRRPALHTALGVSAASGVTTALSSDVPPSRLLLETPIPNVKLLPAGPLTVMPGTMITGDHDIGKLIRELAKLADYVIVDTSPVTIGADASTIASEVDATLMVVDPSAIERPVLLAAVEQLHNADVTVAGAVLNRAEVLLNDRAYQGYYGSRPGQDLAAHVPPPSAGDRSARRKPDQPVN